MDTIKWTRQTAMYTNGWDGRAGKWHCFSIEWATISKDYVGPKWRLNCRLPGIKDNLGLFQTPELAQEKAAKVLAHWLKGLEVSND